MIKSMTFIVFVIGMCFMMIPSKSCEACVNIQSDKETYTVDSSGCVKR